MTHITFNSLLNDLQKTQESRVPWSNNELTTSHPDDLIHSNKVTDKIDHQVHNTGSGTTHSLVHVDPTGKRHVLAVMDVYQHANEAHPYIAYSQVSPKFKGKGFGKALYLQALKHHGSLRSDTHTSPNANKAWEWLGKQPNVLVKMGTPGTEESHIASYNQLAKSENLEKRLGKKKIYSSQDIINHWKGHDPYYSNDNMHEPTIKAHKKWHLVDMPVSNFKLMYGERGITDPENRDYIAENNLVDKLPPIIAVPRDGHYLVLDGEHRTSAAKMSGKTHIKAFVPVSIKKSENLEKGVARKIAPHNPPRGQTAESKFLNYWTTHEDSSAKENLPRHDGAIRFRALNKLSARTKTRVNPETNEKEYLLHRGMGAEEFDKGNSNKSSWTPKFNTAMTFGETYANDDRVNGRSHVVSAWIPESHMHNFPFMLGHDPKIKAYAGEYEVVVNPHKLQIHASGTPVEMRNHIKNKGKLTTIAQSLPLEEKRQIVRKKVDGNLGKSLEKGLKGDWQKEGYTLHVSPSMPLGTPKAKFDPNQHGFVVQAKDKDGKYAGSASIEHKGGNIIPYGITISEPHRRKGLASGIYKHSQELSGKKIMPEYVAEGTEPSGQSGDAKALWNQPNRPFGKSEVNPNHFRNILKKALDAAKLHIEELEKAELPPRKHGERHPHKPYIAKKHTDGDLSWYYDPETSKQYDDFIAQNKDNYINKLKPEHQAVVNAFMSDTQNKFSRHAVPAKDKKPTAQEPNPLDIPRARHIRGLIQNDPNYSMVVHSPDNLTLTAHERHGGTVRTSIFNYSLKKN